MMKASVVFFLFFIDVLLHSPRSGPLLPPVSLPYWPVLIAAALSSCVYIMNGCFHR
jgi:hypothetical protein